MNLEIVFFFVVAAVSVGSAVLMITHRNPVKSVVYLIVNFFCLAVLYLILQAQFIAIIQILVYAGAIMVLFLFVIMLLNLGDESRLVEKRNYRRIIAYLLGAVVLAEIVGAIIITTGGRNEGIHPAAREIGTVEAIGKLLYTQYLFPFEMTSILLLAAMIGVIVLAKKKFQ